MREKAKARTGSGERNNEAPCAANKLQEHSPLSLHAASTERSHLHLTFAAWHNHDLYLSPPHSSGWIQHNGTLVQHNSTLVQHNGTLVQHNGTLVRPPPVTLRRVSPAATALRAPRHASA